jgi:organic radical activating enzyme
MSVTGTDVEHRSYTAAGRMPWKLLQMKEYAISSAGLIRPIHIQLIPTNRCNGNCPWCSCRDVDKSLQLPRQEISNMLGFFAQRGTKAITITGGGEPTLHPDLLSICANCYDFGIKIGLVTNGKKWAKDGVDPDFNEFLLWVRISTMETQHDVGQVDWLRGICEFLPAVALGVSFTVDTDVCVDLAREVCKLAAKQENLTHIRFVQNILDPDKSPMKAVQDACEPLTSKAIFQYRSVFTTGAKRCLISRLKPMIDASGLVYPCCGVQYAGTDSEMRKMPERFSMGHWTEYDHMEPFDGSICAKCYYSDYNAILDGLTTPLEHRFHV